MTDLFVPPVKTPAAPEATIVDDPAPGALDTGNLGTSDAAGVPPAEPAVVQESVALVALASAEAGGTTESAMAPALDSASALALPAGAAVATVDNVFFYGRSATGPVLYQVNLAQGSLSAVSEPVDLFSTALDGLFTAAPGGLGGLGAASTEPPSRTFVVLQGTSGKNFLIGTAADNALLGFSGDDLILTGQGYNLAFGGVGNDTLVGGAGDNGLFGGNGDDAIEGGAGDDLLVGGAGNDILYGGGGANTLVGGAGADVFRLNSPGAYSPLVDPSVVIREPDTILDFKADEGDRLDLSLIANQPSFAGSDLTFLSLAQIGADTHVQITTSLGQTSTEAILLGVQADTITPASIIFTPPTGVPLLK
ncbi:type I secretion C-terminal target domain-containing protein [Nodosilinea sp. AN01ver1]|uniref:calcium-binding protein n=1 Tax=Nodosilinea sp. AN01ver1 TaxID=3423362 RepID=UPI003D31983F